MLVVDSSVWIDFFRNAPKPTVEVLDGLLRRGEVRIVVPDLVFFEVLRGFSAESAFRSARRLMETLDIEATGGATTALAAATNYRMLRAGGVTVHSGIDVLVATFCIERDYALLHHGPDFDAFERFSGLRVWPTEPSPRGH